MSEALAMIQEASEELHSASVGHGRVLVVEPYGEELVGIVEMIPSPEDQGAASEAGPLVTVSTLRFYFDTTGLPPIGKRFLNRATGESYRIRRIENLLDRPFITFFCQAGLVTEDAP